MGMFSGYENLQDNYVPTNIGPKKPCDNGPLKPFKPIKPYEDYNAAGELVGYWFYQGNTVVFDFNIDGEITIDNNDIIYTAYLQAPTVETEGVAGQKAYNINYSEEVKYKSWTCEGFDSLNQHYLWSEDVEFEYPEDGQRDVYVDADAFLVDKQVNVKFYNHRRELLDQKTYAGSTSIKYVIDKEFSEKLPRDVYYISLEIFDNDLVSTLFYQTETTVTIR